MRLLSVALVVFSGILISSMPKPVSQQPVTKSSLCVAEEKIVMMNRRALVQMAIESNQDIPIFIEKNREFLDAIEARVARVCK